MTPHLIKQVQDALAHAMGKVIGAPVTETGKAAKFALPFLDRNGQAFTFYAYQRQGSKKLFFTDAGAALQTLRKSGFDVHLDVMQRTMRTFGLWKIAIDRSGNGSVRSFKDWSRPMAYCARGPCRRSRHVTCVGVDEPEQRSGDRAGSHDSRGDVFNGQSDRSEEVTHGRCLRSASPSVGDDGTVRSEGASDAANAHSRVAVAPCSADVRRSRCGDDPRLGLSSRV
jgi:hypothetical protein